MKLRVWTFRLKPLPDELLSSWLTRVAFAHGQSPYVFHNLHLPGLPIWTRDVDRGRVIGLLGGLSAVSGVSVRRIKAASLDRFRSPGLDAPTHGEWPLVLAAGVYHRKRRRHGLQFCPSCLGSGTAYFRRSWRLAYVLKCAECSTSLLDACPHCDEPLAPHRAIGDLRACHHCGSSISNGSGDLVSKSQLPDGGMQALLTRAVGRRAVWWLGGRQRPSDVFMAAAILVNLLPAKRIDVCRRAIGLPACPARMSSERLERQRLRERALRLETVGRWASNWPLTFRQGASALGLTRQNFGGYQLPASLLDEVTRLPDGQSRTRSPNRPLLGPELRAVKRRSPTSYRHLRARRILEAAAQR